MKLRLAIARLGEATAFAVSDDLALTAFHVVGYRKEVGDKKKGELKHERWELQFSGGHKVGASVEGFDADADVALLRLHAPGLPRGLKSFALSSTMRRSQHWYSHGFPVVIGDRHTVSGIVVDPQATVEGSLSAIQLHCRQAAARAAPAACGL